MRTTVLEEPPATPTPSRPRCRLLLWRALNRCLRNGTRGCCDPGKAWQEVEYQALASAGRGGWHASHIRVPHTCTGKVLFFLSICLWSGSFLPAGGSGSPVCCFPARWSPRRHQVKKLQQLLLVHKLVPFNAGQGGGEHETGNKQGNSQRKIVGLAATGVDLHWLLPNLKSLSRGFNIFRWPILFR